VNKPLTDRQRDVLRAVAEGLTDDQIAQRLGIETCTVVTHVRTVRNILGARNRANAAFLGLAYGILTFDAEVARARRP
jgi:DNA-binding NarL/FixJ family response regulator